MVALDFGQGAEVWAIGGADLGSYYTIISVEIVRYWSREDDVRWVPVCVRMPVYAHTYIRRLCRNGYTFC